MSKKIQQSNECIIGIIGLGYVGLPLAIEFAKHFTTIGYDVSKNRIEKLSMGIDETLEIDNEILTEAENIEFTSKINDLHDCNIFIITVPTPIDPANRPDLSFIMKASEDVAKILKKGDIVIYESTVYPGCTEEVCVPILEQFSKLTFNKDFFCGYSPERINPGDKINTISKIKKITSGSNSEVSSFIDNLYKTIIEAGTYEASSIKVAEAAKVIENTQRDLNIALVNELSVIFNKLNIDTIDVLQAAGSKWNFLPFRPGLVGGHCIGVDPYYLTHKAEQVKYSPQVILAGRRINDNMATYSAKKIIQNMINRKLDVTNSKIGILGITFKENCPDIRNSKVYDLIMELKDWGLETVVEDAWADPKDVMTAYGINLEKISKSNQVDALVVAVGHNEYRQLSARDLKNLCKGANPFIADLKSLYDRNKLNEEGFSVFRL